MRWVERKTDEGNSGEIGGNTAEWEEGKETGERDRWIPDPWTAEHVGQAFE